MKRFFKQLGILLLFMLIAGIILTLVIPTHQTIERSITINAPAGVIYEKMKLLKNFNQVMVWNQRDSAIVNTISGTDGTVGARSDWKGDPLLSGTGHITITDLEPSRQVTHQVVFITPKKGKAISTFYFSGPSQSTTVKWTFNMKTPRPWNIFNLFYKLDKEVGKDFEEGLAELKKMIETT